MFFDLSRIASIVNYDSCERCESFNDCERISRKGEYKSCFNELISSRISKQLRRKQTIAFKLRMKVIFLISLSLAWGGVTPRNGSTACDQCEACKPCEKCIPCIQNPFGPGLTSFPFFDFHRWVIKLENHRFENFGNFC